LAVEVGPLYGEIAHVWDIYGDLMAEASGEDIDSISFDQIAGGTMDDILGSLCFISDSDQE